MGMKLFGRNYNEIGDIDSDFCIKTRGQVKVQYGKKFIDLIKDGKVNVDAEFLFKVKDKDAIKGKDGIYLVGDEDLYVKVGDLIIPITGTEVDDKFVAYEEQDKEPEEQTIAQKNIGISFDSVEDFAASGIKNGFAYIISEGKFYSMKNGEPEEMISDLPVPYTKPIWVKVGTDGTNTYSLFIDGYFSANGAGIVMGSESNGMHMYCEQNKTFIDCNGEIIFQIDGVDSVKVSREIITFKSDLKVDESKKIETERIQSGEGSVGDGFLMYVDNAGESHLYIDHLHVRMTEDTANHVLYEELLSMIEKGNLTPNLTYMIDDFQNEWDMVDIIKEDQFDDDGKLVRRRNILPILVTAVTAVELSKYAKYADYPLWDLIYDAKYNDLIYNDYDGEPVKAKGRIIRMYDEYGNVAPYDFKNLKFLMDGKWRYTFGNEIDMSLYGEYYNNEVQGDYKIIEKRCVENEANVQYCLNEGKASISIYGKEVHDNIVGVLTGKFFFDNGDAGIFKDNKLYAEELGEVNIKGDFISNSFTCDKILNTDFPKGAYNVVVHGGFDNCQFEEKQLIHDYFHSTFENIQFFGDRFFDKLYTDKVTDVYMNDGKLRVICIPDFCWPGMISMYNGEWDLPECWAVCDGSNGTPDLTGCFIRANTKFGPASPDKYMDYPFEINSGNVPLPDHTHNAGGGGEGDGTTRMAGDIYKSKIVIAPFAEGDGEAGGEGGEEGGGGCTCAGVVETDLIERKLLIKLPKFYDIIFIMYIGR